jgi:hypothetical protein
VWCAFLLKVLGWNRDLFLSKKVGISHLGNANRAAARISSDLFAEFVLVGLVAALKIPECVLYGAWLGRFHFCNKLYRIH